MVLSIIYDEAKFEKEVSIRVFSGPTLAEFSRLDDLLLIEGPLNEMHHDLVIFSLFMRLLLS